MCHARVLRSTLSQAVVARPLAVARPPLVVAIVASRSLAAKSHDLAVSCQKPLAGRMPMDCPPSGPLHYCQPAGLGQHSRKQTLSPKCAQVTETSVGAHSGCSGNDKLPSMKSSTPTQAMPKLSGVRPGWQPQQAPYQLPALSPKLLATGYLSTMAL